MYSLILISHNISSVMSIRPLKGTSAAWQGVTIDLGLALCSRFGSAKLLNIIVIQGVQSFGVCITDYSGISGLAEIRQHLHPIVMEIINSPDTIFKRITLVLVGRKNIIIILLLLVLFTEHYKNVDSDLHCLHSLNRGC